MTKINTLKLPIYLDNAATTPVDPRVVEKMLTVLRDYFGNPSADHYYGQQAAELIAVARQHVAELIGAAPREIIWTSGATESINLAIKGVAHFYKNKSRHIVTCQTEHSAVLASCAQLEQEGFSVTYLAPEKNGLIAISKLAEALRPDTILVSLQHVNNEIGVIQDVSVIAELTRAKNILFHVDATQSVGKIPMDLTQSKIDLMSFSAHKLYGPKGVGALYLRQFPRVELEAQMQGGKQEHGLRAGTLATAQIVGMGEAFRLAKLEMSEENDRIAQLRDRLWQDISDLPAVHLNGDVNRRVSGILNVAFGEIKNVPIIAVLSELAVTASAACRSTSHASSHVLRAIGLPDELARNAIRFSLGRFTTEKEIDFAVNKIREGVRKLRN